MAFDELIDHTEKIQDEAQNFVESNIAYYKLKGFKMAMQSMTMIAKFFLVFLCFLMVLLFCSIAGAYAIGQYLDSFALGFLIVGAIYFLVTVFLIVSKDKIVEGPILKKFSEIFFND